MQRTMNNGKSLFCGIILRYFYIIILQSKLHKSEIDEFARLIGRDKIERNEVRLLVTNQELRDECENLIDILDDIQNEREEYDRKLPEQIERRK